MKKILLSTILAASCSAFAGIPEGYAPIEGVDDEKTLILHNDKTGGVISIAQIDYNGETYNALELAEELSASYKCKDKPDGEETFAHVGNCEKDGEIWDFFIGLEKDFAVLMLYNKKATLEEIKELSKKDE